MSTQVDPPLPRVLDDVWEPPPRPNRLPIVVGASAGALLIASIAVVTINSALREPHPMLAAAPAPVRNSLWYPDDLNDSTGSLSRFRNPVAAPRAPAVIHDRPSPKPVVRRPALPPPPPPPPAPGYLSINSTPWAELSVDGRVVGNTPQLGIRVAPGRHRLVLVRDGFAAETTWVTVAPGATVKNTGLTLKRVAP
jgi:PEGA domain-containing protein